MPSFKYARIVSLKLIRWRIFKIFFGRHDLHAISRCVFLKTFTVVVLPQEQHDHAMLYARRSVLRRSQ